ncbi:MAG: DNA translocase FtsK 4TM domain-containing protein [Lachnospiraceae bacterium]|nr:DNA translocase FtsK 4TM domain-containing protein [Lachnospiraceae bacterium]
MAARKSTAAQGTRTRTSAPRTRAAVKAQEPEEAVITSNVFTDIILWLCIAVAGLVILSLFGIGGIFGVAVSTVLFGFFGILAYIFPFAIVGGAFFAFSNQMNRKIRLKMAAICVCFLLLCAVVELFLNGDDPLTPFAAFSDSHLEHTGGGFFGAVFAWIFYHIFGTVGAYIVTFVLIIICAVIVLEKSPLKNFNDRAPERRRKRREFVSGAREHIARDIDRMERERELRRRHEESRRRAEERLARNEQRRKVLLKETERMARENEKTGQIIEAASFAPPKEEYVAAPLKEGMAAQSDEISEIKVRVFDNPSDLQPAAEELVPIDRTDYNAEPVRTVSWDESHPTVQQIAVSQMWDQPAAEDNRAFRYTESAVESMTAGAYAAAEYRQPDAGAEQPVQLFSEIGASAYEEPQTAFGEPQLSYEEYQTVFEEPHLSYEEPQFANGVPEAAETYTLPDNFDFDEERTLGTIQVTAEPQEMPDITTFSDVARVAAQMSDTAQMPDIAGMGVSEEGYEDQVIELTDARNEKGVSGQPQDMGYTENAQIHASAEDMVNAQIAANPIATADEQMPANPETSANEQMTAGEAQAADAASASSKDITPPLKPYQFPPIELLKRSSGNVQTSKEALQKTSDDLKRILSNFGVEVEMEAATCGPTVTRYELKPAAGVKVSKIVNLADDIKLNLAAADIRIEAPIPGKQAVGIEVPNKEPVTVAFGDLMADMKFRSEKSRIAFAAGRDIGGDIIISDIAKMPHLLIAGATGSGKSVCINTIIMSILYKAAPEDVKMIMIDPKVVELSVYNGIPHLLIPVVTDPKKATGALNWAVQEMMKRYETFANIGVRKMEEYNSKIVDGYMDIDGQKVATPRMPQIVIIVDELADLMMVASNEVEDAIVRLTQLARAAGIHLVIATQRPSVNVITGLIKANMPSRIAFSVTSGVDSRTILDMVGAEKLLGKGDMLYYPQSFTKPLRVQGAFVSDKEVADVVSFIKKNNEAQADANVAAQINEAAAGGGANASASAAAEDPKDDKDAYFDDAARLLIDKGKGSIGMLQRYFKVGFNRAARIMDQLAEAGIVGPEVGTKPREVIMTLEEYESLNT